MDTIYANRFSITTNENKESFITFYLDIPKYDADGKFTGMDTIQKTIVILTESAYENFRSMLDRAEEKGGKTDENQD